MTVEEFVNLGRCPECGTPRWRQAVCACGHGVTFHDFGKRQGATVRTACSVTDETGHCECRMFAEVPSD